MEPKYIIVQAGGKGTRLEYLTMNRPKALVPIQNRPMLFHLFEKYPKSHFIIIGDYKYDVLERYLAAFANVEYDIVNASGFSGTNSGLRAALSYIPDQTGFMLIWSDLVLPENFSVPEEDNNYIGLSGDFPCRWKYENGIFQEERSVEYGVSGLFVFRDKKVLQDVPLEGEFVAWLSGKNLECQTLTVRGTKEYGLLEEYNKLSGSRCRPFNRITIDGNRLIKEGIDEQGKQLAIREKAWYRKAEEFGFCKMPKIYSYEPFVMEKIDGRNIFEYQFDFEEKKDVLKKIIQLLKELHSCQQVEVEEKSVEEAYYGKTVQRLKKIQKLVPFGEREYIVINGKKCKNVFFHFDELKSVLNQIKPEKFSFIHGDCTFSNMILKNGREPVVIDPRGYFGYTELYGDPMYDWAKLYYSIVGNYDRFNIKDFRLKINEDDVELSIASNGWEDMESEFFALLKGEADEREIKLVHAVIWLSLTTYAWEDYDSICGAFYNGILHLEDVL